MPALEKRNAQSYFAVQTIASSIVQTQGSSFRDWAGNAQGDA
jgi:hypothetical protein